MTSLNPTTGKDDGFLHLNISGNYQFPGVAPTPPASTTSSSATAARCDLVEGDFTSVGGQPRQQIFMLNLATAGTVTGWTSPEWDGSRRAHVEPDGYPYQCVASRSTSRPRPGRRTTRPSTSRPPATTRTAGPTGSSPRTGLCDAAAAFPATPDQRAGHKWINYTGCDSLYSTAADASTAYFGGHERWASATPTAATSPARARSTRPAWSGSAPANRQRRPFNPTRGRGLGADDMLITRGAVDLPATT